MLGCHHKLCYVLIVLITALRAAGKDFNIIDYGAKPNVEELNTKSIQAAIDAASDYGGGRVIIPEGNFVSGSIHLKSNVELHLEKKACLTGSLDYRDYDIERWAGFVMAKDCENIAITGNGTIDGRGHLLGPKMDSLFYAGDLDSSMYNFIDQRPKAQFRPMTILLTKCKNIKVLDVSLKNSPSWVQNYVVCENLTIDGIRVSSDSYWNNDGIDIVDCNGVTITNSVINSADDGICLKSFTQTDTIAYCENIHISNCRIRSSASAVKLGMSSRRGFKNISIKNIKIIDTYRSAIALEVIQGGLMENVIVENIKAKNTGNAIFIRLDNRHKLEKVKKDTSVFLRHIILRNIKVKVPFKRPDYDYNMRGPALPFFYNPMPSSITGIPGYRVENVKLENVKIIYPGRGNRAYKNIPLNQLYRVPENEGDYPEFTMFGELPAWGFYVRHVDGLEFNNVKIKIRKPDHRPAVVLDDVQNIKFENLKILNDKKENKIVTKDVKNLQIID